VIYCKFWELDTDHDFLIDKENLIRYGNHSLTYRIVDRIFSQVSLFHRGILTFLLVLTKMSFHILTWPLCCLGPKEIHKHDRRKDGL
jgi:hypothetical protein